ncbi:MAG: Apea-like [Dehalococcoidia bacterium]|nr:Apea-like [Dehalococcoidia bacterium]
MAIPVRFPEGNRSPRCEPGFEELFRISDDAAHVVGLCLDQRTPLKRVAAYIRQDRDKDKPGSMLATWQLSGGAAASISDKSVESVRLALDHARNPQVPPRVLLALRWYDLSKNASTGADRLVSLWVSLEALIGTERPQRELVTKTAQHLAKAEYGLGLRSAQIRQALGLDKMLAWRNKIMHEGVCPVPWPIVPGDPGQRDWPQILCDVVGEILRCQLSASLTGSLRRHIDAGLIMAAS